MSQTPFSARAGRPLVAIASDRIERHGHPAHALLHGYVRAVSERAGAVPLALPAAPGAVDVASLVHGIDGIVLTGSPSNVAPEHYGAGALPEGVLLDRDRDATVLPLLPQLVSAGVPVLAVCRGFQEMNVAWGGTLDAAVHSRSGRLDHREGDHGRPIERWYDDSHDIHIAPGGVLAGLVPLMRLPVNSLHHQGIERLAPGLRVAGYCPGRPDRGLHGRRRTGVHARSAVASGDARRRQRLRPRDLHRLRRCLPRPDGTASGRVRPATAPTASPFHPLRTP